MAKPQELAVPTFTEQETFLPLEQEIFGLVDESVKKQIEIERLDPTKSEDIPRIQDIIRQKQKVAEAPRTITGERQLQAPEFIESALSYLGPLEQPARALLPKRVLTPGEVQRAEQQFEEEVLPNIYVQYREAVQQGTEPDPGLDLDSTETYQNFVDAMKEKYGTRGQYIVKEEGIVPRFKAGAEILGTELLGAEVPTPEGPEVQERLVGTLLRDLLTIEAGVTAVGQEIGELFGGERVGNKDFTDRWAQNIQEARGLEQLASDVTGDTLEGVGFSKDTADNIADYAWWLGLGAGFVLPLDFYLGAAGKGAAKAFRKAASAAAESGARPAKASGVARVLDRVEAAEDVGLQPADVRLDIAEEAAAIGKYGDEAEAIIKSDQPVSELNKLDIIEATQQTDRTLARIQETATGADKTYIGYIRQAVKQIGEEPKFDQNNKLVIPKEGVDPVDAVDAIELITASLAERLARRALKENIEQGKSLIPSDYTMLTPKLAVPNDLVRPILASFKENTQLFQALDDFNVDAVGRMFEARGIPRDNLGMEPAFTAMEIASREGAPLAEINRARRLVIDRMVELEAEARAPGRIFTAAELERLYARSAEIAKQQAVPVKAEEIGKVPATRAQRIRAVRNIERIDDIVTPEQLKTSSFTKIMSATKNYIAPEGFQLDKYPFNKYFKVPGIGKPPIYRATFGKLLDRLGNIGEELRTEYGRIKVTEKVGNIEAYGILHSRIFKDPEQHTIEFIKAGFGASDDVGTVLGTRYGLNQFINTKQPRINSMIDQLISSGDGVIADLVAAAKTFDRFSPEYFEFLSGVVVLLSGKSIETIDSGIVSLFPKVRPIDMPVFRFDPDKTGSNVANLLVAGKRTKIIDDFSKEIVQLHPELFENPVPDLIETWDYVLRTTFPRAIDVEKELLSRGVRGSLLEIEQTSDAITNVFQQVILPKTESFDILEAAFEDRIIVAQGGNPHKVYDRLASLFIEETEFMTDLAIPGGAYLDYGIPERLVDELNLITLENTVDFVSEVFATKLYNNAFVNEIFQETYVNSVSRNLPPERVSEYMEALKSKLRSEMKVEENATSFVQAVEDLPLYVFDTPNAMRSDLLGVLDDSSLVRRYNVINQRWIPIEGASPVRDMFGDPTTTRAERSRRDLAVHGLDVVTVPLREGDLQTFKEQLLSFRKALSVATDTSPGYTRLARRIANFTASELWNSFGYVRNITKGGILAGNLILNPKYHIVNALSAPAIVLSTLGLKAGLQSPLPRGSTQVLSHLYSAEFGGIIPVAEGARKIVETPTGKTYTVGEIADMVQQNNIAISRVRAEIPNQIFEDFVRWTGENFGEFGRTEPVINFLKQIYQKSLAAVGATGRTIWGELASATDNYFRVNVLLAALRRGESEANAIKLARESLFDYNNLTKFERDVIMKGIWIYSFRAQSFRTLISNITNNPTRLAQQYKLVRGLPDDEEESYTPFMTKYKTSKVMMGIYNDTDTRLRYAIYGPDVPMIDAMDDLVSVSSHFAALAAGEASLTGAIAGAGMAALAETDPVARTPLTAAGYEIAFGEISEAGTYINPSYINFLVATGNWETFKTFFNVVARAPRRGKPTHAGFEWQINRDDKDARMNFLLFRNALLLTGIDRPVREWSDILVPQLEGDVMRYGIGQPWWDIPVATGIGAMEQMQDEAQRRETIRRAVQQELE